MKQIIGGKEYNTETATLLASDRYWDGSNFERNGRNTYLYKTPNGRYFAHHTTQWQGELNTIEALEVEEAKALYEELHEHESEYEEAFGVAMNEQSKSDQGLELLNRYWHILPWHLKAKIILISEFYYLRHKALTFLFGEAKAG